MNEVKIASVFISYYRRKVKNLPMRAWIEWRETLPEIFSEKIESASIDISINSGKKFSRKLSQHDDLSKLLVNLTKEEKIQILSLIELYRLAEENREDYIPGTFRLETYEELVALFDVSESEKKEATDNAENWSHSKIENNFHTHIKVPGTLKIVLFDFLLRWIALYCYKTYDWNDIGEPFGMNQLALFLVLQIVLIPLIVVIFAIYRNKKVSGKIRFLIEKTGKQNIKLSTGHSAWNYLTTILLVLAGCLIMTFVQSDTPLILVIILGVTLSIYLFSLLSIFSRSVPPYKNILEQIKYREHRDLQDELSHDENDEEIVSLEVLLKSSNEKMNAYVIEAALFGALAFSGFLTLISSGDFTIEHIVTFNSQLMQVIGDFLTFQSNNDSELIRELLSKESLFAIISYQSLFCSIFFLSVIASRLRVSSITDAIDRSIQVAKAFNDKEEELIRTNSEFETDARFISYNRKIRESIKSGFKKQDELEPIISYMQFFRNLGIGAFFLIVITSGLFISKELTIILALISILSISYFYLLQIKEWLKTVRIWIQEFYFRIDKPVHWIAWSIIFIALIMRSIQIELGNPTMVIGFLILNLHYLMNLFIPVEISKIEDEENEIEHLELRKAIQYVFKAAIALFFTGYTFKALHWPGASVLLTISLILLCFYFGFENKLQARKKFLSPFLSLSICIPLLAILFKIQHWPAGPLLIYTSTVLLSISLYLIYRFRNEITGFIKKSLIILSLVIAFFWHPFLRWGLMNLSFSYESFNMIQDLGIYQKDFYAPVEDGGLSNASSPEDIRLLKERIAEFNEKYVDNDNADPEFLNEWAWGAFESSENALIIEAAIHWSEKSLEIDSENWMYIDTYASLLYKAGRLEEALVQAKIAYEKGNDPATRDLIEKIESALK